MCVVHPWGSEAVGSIEGRSSTVRCVAALWFGWDASEPQRGLGRRQEHDVLLVEQCSGGRDWPELGACVGGLRLLAEQDQGGILPLCLARGLARRGSPSCCFKGGIERGSGAKQRWRHGERGGELWPGRVRGRRAAIGWGRCAVEGGEVLTDWLGKNAGCVVPSPAIIGVHAGTT